MVEKDDSFSFFPSAYLPDCLKVACLLSLIPLFFPVALILVLFVVTESATAARVGILWQPDERILIENDGEAIS